MSIEALAGDAGERAPTTIDDVDKVQTRLGLEIKERPDLKNE